MHNAFINAYIAKLLQTCLIETESNMGIMVCLGQGLLSPSALSNLFVVKHYSKIYEWNPMKFYGGVRSGIKNKELIEFWWHLVFQDSK